MKEEKGKKGLKEIPRVIKPESHVHFSHERQRKGKALSCSPACSGIMSPLPVRHRLQFIKSSTDSRRKDDQKLKSRKISAKAK